MQQPNCLNSQLRDRDDWTRVALFRETREGVHYVKRIHFPWKDLPDAIIDLGKNRKWSPRVISIKRINDPCYVHIACFFQNPGQKVEVLSLKAYVESKSAFKIRL